MAKTRDVSIRLRALDRISKVLDRVTKKFPKLSRSIRRASRATKIFNAQTKRMRAALLKVGRTMKRVGVTMTVALTLPLVLLGAKAVKIFGDFQQGLRGIEKTTGLARGEVAKLGETFDEISTKIPVTTQEMLELTKAGGQLGVKGAANLEKFTLVMAKLGRASDVVGEEGAKAIARILTVTGDGIPNIDRFASALVDLGNNAAASESEILGIAVRISTATARFGVGSASVLGMSTALKALGLRAEASGGVIGRAFDSIDQSIRQGGERFKALSVVTGIATKDLKKQFETDSGKVFRKFIFGMNRLGKEGKNTTKILAGFNLSGIRINAVLGTLIKKPETLAENMDRASKAFKENIALQKEFDVQTDSFNSSMKILSNTFISLGRLIGATLAPAVKFLAGVFTTLIQVLRKNPVLRTFVIVLASMLAVLGPIILAVGAFILLLPTLTALMVALGVASLPITGTILAIAGVVLLLTAGITFLIVKFDAIKRFFNTNPFGKFIQFVVLVMSPIGAMIQAVELLINVFRKLAGLKALNIIPTFSSLFGKKAPLGFLGAPESGVLGPSIGAGGPVNKLGEEKSKKQDIGGILNVDFANAPAGMRVRAKSSGVLDFNLGLNGGIQ